MYLKRGEAKPGEKWEDERGGVKENEYNEGGDKKSPEINE